MILVNDQEKSESVMMDKSVPSNYWHFHVSVTKIHSFKVFYLNIHTKNIEKSLEHAMKTVFLA